MPVRTQRSPVDALDDDDDDDYDDGDPVTPPMPSSFRRYHTRWRTGRQPPDGPSSTSPAERATLANDRRGHGVARAAASKQRVFTYRHGHDSIIPFVHRHRHAVSSVAAGRNPPATPGPSSPSYSPLPGAAPPPCAYCQQTREVVEELKTQFDAFTTFRDGLAEAVARNSRVVECHCPGHVDTDGMVGMDWQHEATTLVRYAERRPSHVLRQVLATGVSSGASLLLERELAEPGSRLDY